MWRYSRYSIHAQVCTLQVKNKTSKPSFHLYITIKKQLFTEEEVDATEIHYINATNYISMNDDYKFIDKYDALFLSSKNHEDIYSVS